MLVAAHSRRAAGDSHPFPVTRPPAGTAVISEGRVGYQDVTIETLFIGVVVMLSALSVFSGGWREEFGDVAARMPHCMQLRS